MIKLALYIFLLLLTTTLYAQTEKQLTVSEIRQQTILDEPLTMQQGYLRIAAGLSYFMMSSNYCGNDWKSTSVPSLLSKDFIFPFSIFYGLTNNLELNVSTPIIYMNTTNKFDIKDYYFKTYSKMTTIKSIARGFSNFVCNLNYKFLDETPNLPSMIISAKFSAPIGKATPTISNDSLTVYETTTTGEYSLGVEYELKKTFYPYSIVGDFYYTYRFPTDQKLDYSDIEKTHIKYGDYTDFNISFHYMLCDWITLGNMFEYSYTGADKYNNSNYSKYEVNIQEISWQPALIFQIKNIRLVQKLYIMLLGKNTISQPSFSVGLGIKI